MAVDQVSMAVDQLAETSETSGCGTEVSSALQLHRRRNLMWSTVLAFATLTLIGNSSARSDDLQKYQTQCDLATGVTVPDFDCDKGDDVPGQGSVFSGDAPGVTCDEPNRLNRQCDPHSHFQVLTRSDDAYVVAHCRHEGGDQGRYGDIAVIQYNRKNGATCFYQSLGNQSHGDLPGGSSSSTAITNNDKTPVKAPSKGGPPSWPWMTPQGVAHASFACGSCHDNGPFIRSPYLNQIKGVNSLPGSDFLGPDGFFFNGDATPYAFVGQDFASWKAFKVEIPNGNECTGCHRLGVNNLGSGGTALDFALRATVTQLVDVSVNPDGVTFKNEESKNSPSTNSPIWMPPQPVQTAFSQTHAKAAKAIHDCANRRSESPLPNGNDCRITQFAGAFVSAPTIPSLAAIIELTQIPLR